jgi:hypothetical protein
MTGGFGDQSALRPRLAWMLLVLALLALRVPSLVQPPGNDQSLYTYAAGRLLDGGVPYRDAWDQKPPGIVLVYAAVRSLWRGDAAVGAADLAAAAAIAWLLVILGRRTVGEPAGWAAASLYLLFAHPSLTRLSGLYVRSQCETFIGVAVTAALVLLAAPGRRRLHVLAAGIALGFAIWLKYNAVAYALPVALAVRYWPVSVASPGASLRRDLSWVFLGATMVTVLFLAYFASHGALLDLRLATIDYNLQYSGETYRGLGHVLSYPIAMPISRARVDLLWFLGGVGGVALAAAWRRDRTVSVILAWLAGAILSITINGARSLPQYFVQAGPALAFAAGAGGLLLAARPRLVRAAVAAALLLALWRVGDEPTRAFGLRLGGMPDLLENVRFDLQYALGGIDRATYLARFKTERYDAQAIEDLAAHVRRTTRPEDRIFVFGFAPGIYVKGERASPSRFFWSRPIVIEFGAGRPGYGSAGLLEDLDASRPALFIVQKRDWGPGGDRDSAVFLADAKNLRVFLNDHYVPDRDNAVFSVWRRKS